MKTAQSSVPSPSAPIERAPTVLDVIRAEQKNAKPGAIAYRQENGAVKRAIAVVGKRPGGVNRG